MMLKRMTVGLLMVAICSTGLSCAVQPPADGGNGGGSGGGDGGGGDGGGGDGGGGDGGGGIAGFVGALTVNSSRAFSQTGEVASISGGAIFTTVEDINDGIVETKTIGVCVVTTVEFGSGSTDGAPTTDPLDAGIEGSLSTATAQATLTKLTEGVYGTAELAGGDFSTGETYTFEFDGGTDIAGFMTSVMLPGAFSATTPDLTDDNLMIDKSAALDVAWAPSGGADGVTVQVSTADLATFVSIVCTFDDTGSATVPQAAMECLLDTPTSTTVSIARTNSAEIEVDLTEGGTGTLFVSAQTGDARTIIEGATTGGVDPCDFIPCPEGTTCNPNTFLCE